MRWSRILATVISVFLAFIAGALIGAYPGRVAGEGQMLAGGAIVAFYMLIGGGIAVALVGYYCSRQGSRKIWRLAIGLFFVAALLIFHTRYSLAERRVKRQMTPDTVAPKVDTVMKVEQDGGTALEGYGFVGAPFNREGLKLYFYPGTDYFEAPVDSLVYDTEGYRNTLVYAPPYLLPYYLKEDYESLYFRLTGTHGNRVQIELNADTGQRGWVDRPAVSIFYWPDFLQSVFAVYPLDPATNPVRQRPLPHAAAETNITADEILLSERVEGDWIFVRAFVEGDSETGFSGWIRWRDGDRLLVGWDYRL
ncbi:hypothetical protein [Lewinella sp. JB7]|uniref:hypothetical protein n=1 Tax=Lewinella sp. JB7 TaxID=2962887 RepID=UPI0020CA2540|nr:hypothetical protein [Lewinella sp. JB7]MCP9237726.1 hypothetical protein [Lewinella sp. JB7]